MKAVNKLVVLLGLSALLPFAAFAKTLEQTYIETASKAPGVPVPVAVVSPSVSADYAGSTVRIAFTVDAKGSPIGFTVVSSPDAMVARAVTEAVSKWRFTPASKNGEPVATKVVLPVRFAGDVGFALN